MVTYFCVCCLERRPHRTKNTVVVNTESNAPAVWSAVRVTTCDIARTTIPESKITYPGLFGKVQCFHVPENRRRSFAVNETQDRQQRPNYKNLRRTVVNRYYCLVKKPKLTMNPALGMVSHRSRISVCRPAAVVHGYLGAFAPSSRSFERALITTPFRSVPLSHVKPKCPSQLSKLISERNTSCKVSSIHLFSARRLSNSLLVCCRSEHPDGAIPSMQAYVGP